MEYVVHTGKFKDYKAGNSKYLPASIFTLDFHGTDPDLIGDPGVVANQLSLFWDQRTGAKDIVMAHSGFKITREIVQDPATGKWKLVVTKVRRRHRERRRRDRGGYDPEAGITEEFTP